MTSPIKPPGGKPPIPPNPAVDQVGPAGKGGFSDAVQAAAEAAETTESTSGTQDASAASSTGAEKIADRLQSGQIDSETAMEELVQRAMQNPSVRGLSTDAKADLEATLRATIANDPTFAMLRKDLDR